MIEVKSVSRYFWKRNIKNCLFNCLKDLRNNHHEPWKRTHVNWIMDQPSRISLIVTDPRIKRVLTKNLITAIKNKPQSN
jgi:hypothetical protein